MKTIKIIDLLNKIANGEDVPEYVKYYNMLNDKIEIMMVCKENIFYKLDQLEIQLNSRVEIYKEDKKIEKLDIVQTAPNSWCLRDSKGKLCSMNKHTSIVANKVQELIDEVNKLKEQNER